MKRAFCALTLSLLASSGFGKQLTILHTNDLHSHIGAHGPGGRYGGYDRVAEVINGIRATTPNVLLLDAGDWIEGSFYFRFNKAAAVDPEEWCGTADLSVMKAMGYNAIVLGNHDYIDYNHTKENGYPAPDTVIQRLQRANVNFPIISYNFIPAAVPALDPYLVNEGDATPYVLLDVNGIKVAISGMSEELFVYQMYLTDSSLKDPTTAGYAQGIIDLMNAANPDLTMLLNHVGHGTDQQLAQANHGCDVIVGGHSHSVLFSVDTQTDSQGKPVHVVQAGSQGLYVGRLDLNIDDVTKAVTVVNYQLIPVDQNTPSDPIVGPRVTKLRNSVIAKNGNVFNDSVATMTVDIEGGSMESSVGNIIVDAVFAKTSGAPYSADMAWISDGAVSNPGDIILDGLRKGNVRSEDVYRLYGHGYNPVADANFRIFLLDYTGAQLRFLQETFNFGDLVAALGQGLFINMAGGQINYDPTLPDGNRITSFLVGGQPIVDTQTYTVAVGEAELQTLQYAKDKGLLGFDPSRIQTTGIQVWTAIKDYLAAASPVPKTAVDMDGRYRTAEPDLSVSNYDISITPPTYKIGDTVNINVVVENFGLAGSTGGTLEVYRDKTPYDWSDDPSYDSTSLIGTATVPAVAAFPATTTVTVPWTVTGVAPGKVPLYARLTGLTGEQNATNHFAFNFSDGLTLPWRILGSTGPGATNAPALKAFAGLGTPDVTATFAPYSAGGYGCNVSAGDIDGTATDDEVITGAGPGAVYGPQFRAFRLAGTAIQKVNAYAYGTLKYGVNVAAGDIEGDGYAEIVTGAGPGAVFGPHVRAFNYDGTTLTAINKVSFFAYSTLKYGVNVNTGRMDADNPYELLTAPGPGAIFSPQIRGFNYDGIVLGSIGKINFNAFSTSSYGGRVSAGDIDRDNFDEILTTQGPGPTLASQVRGYNYDGVAITALAKVNYFPFGSYLYGAKTASGDVDGDGYAEILASPGPDPAAQARILGGNVDSATQLGPRDLNFLAFDPEKYGCNVAFADLAP